jgi:Mn-dependent DtxR family transcriptional regulator
LKKKYSITIDDDDDIFIVDPVRIQILKSIPIGKKTISSKVAVSLDIKRRRALEFLNKLEEEGYLESEFKILRFKSGSRAKTRIFKRIK